MTIGEGEIATDWVKIPTPENIGDWKTPAGDPYIPTLGTTIQHLAGNMIHIQRLRLQFDWLDDRHRMQLWRDVELNEEHGSQLLLTSVEGTPHNRWPPSPPLQSLAIEERGEQAVALAVGMAGGAHWSASIETLPEPLSLRFDYACRLTEVPEFLGSSFAIAAAKVEMISVGELVGQQSLESGQLRITADPPVALNSVLTARWQFTLRYLARTNAS